MATLALNGKIIECHEPVSHYFLRSMPPGSYTTARATKCSIFDWQFHLKRLSYSCQILFDRQKEEAEGSSDSDISSPSLILPTFSVDHLAPLINHTSAISIAEYLRLNPDCTSELKLTILITWTEQLDLSIYAHVTLLRPLPFHPIQVQILGKPRVLALAKSSKWVLDRKSLEEAKNDGVHDLVLCEDEEGTLFEGSSCNFFIVNDKSEIVTAPLPSVLEGSVRGVVLSISQQKRTDLIAGSKLEHPSLSTIHTWKEAFISSSTRFVLPISAVYVPNTLYNRFCKAEGEADHSEPFVRVEFSQFPVCTFLRSELETQQLEYSFDISSHLHE